MSGKAVKKDFAGDKRSSVVKLTRPKRRAAEADVVEAEMQEDDAFLHFAISGSPPIADSLKIYNLIREYNHDFLDGFALEVIGVPSGDGMKAVPVNQGSDVSALEAKITEMREKFMYEGTQLNVVTVDHLDAFTLPPGIEQRHLGGLVQGSAAS